MEVLQKLLVIKVYRLESWPYRKFHIEFYEHLLIFFVSFSYLQFPLFLYITFILYYSLTHLLLFCVYSFQISIEFFGYNRRIHLRCFAGFMEYYLNTRIRNYNCQHTLLYFISNIYVNCIGNRRLRTDDFKVI